MRISQWWKKVKLVQCSEMKRIGLISSANLCFIPESQLAAAISYEWIPVCGCVCLYVRGHICPQTPRSTKIHQKKSCYFELRAEEDYTQVEEEKQEDRRIYKLREIFGMGKYSNGIRERRSVDMCVALWDGCWRGQVEGSQVVNRFSYFFLNLLGMANCWHQIIV